MSSDSAPAIESRLVPLDELELKDLRTGYSSSAAADQGAVDGSSAVSFVGDVQGQMKEDILNSTLLAQLAANAQFNPQKQATDWFKFYSNVLQNVGWVVPTMQWSEINNPSASTSVDKLVLTLASQFLTGEGLVGFQNLVTAMADTRNSAPVRVFDQRSSSQGFATFQLGTATNAQGNAQFKISTYNYSTSGTITSVLFLNFGSHSVQFHAGHVTMVLSETVYAQLRAAVLDKLGQDALAFIQGLVF